MNKEGFGNREGVWGKASHPLKFCVVSMTVYDLLTIRSCKLSSASCIFIILASVTAGLMNSLHT